MSYDELSRDQILVSDEELEQEYKNINFVEEDF